MKVIHKPKDYIVSLLGIQQYNSLLNYRENYFLIKDSIDNKLVIFNNLTKSCYALENKEIAAFTNRDLKHPTIKKMFQEYYFVPEDFCELDTYNQILDIFHVTRLKKKLSNKYSTFVVLPTTECNARCFYCYENGCKKMSMDKKQAHEVSKFIINNRIEDKPIHLSWFGGEPLVGLSAIRTLFKDLEKENIEWKSSIISNSYLINEELAKEFAEYWNLKSIQVTLDGLEDTYNSVKSYVNTNDPSPFQTVLNNIEYLLNNKIRVSIRINISPDNEGELYDLVDLINDRYKDKTYLSVYAHNIFQIENPDDEEQFNYYLKFEHDLTKYIQKLGLSSIAPLPTGLKINECMADAPNSVVILPNGDLTSCEHFNETLEPWGNIKSQNVNQHIIDKWCVKHSPTDRCYTCCGYPSCKRLKECPGTNPSCVQLEQEYFLQSLKERLAINYKTTC